MFFKLKRPILFPVTYQCNLNCFYCSEKDKRNIVIDIDKSLDLISKNDNDWVYITGGEPLLIPNLKDVCKRLKDMGKKVGLTTNGTINDFSYIDYVDRVGVSIDGDEYITDKFRGQGTYSKALKYLEELTKYSIETVIMATTNERNEFQERYLEELGEKLGITYLQVTLC